MYICLCHGFTDKQVRSAIADGRRSVAEIYSSLGARPRCGKCVCEVRALVACAAPGGAGEVAGTVCAPQTE